MVNITTHGDGASGKFISFKEVWNLFFMISKFLIDHVYAALLLQLGIDDSLGKRIRSILIVNKLLRAFYVAKWNS